LTSGFGSTYGGAKLVGSTIAGYCTSYFLGIPGLSKLNMSSTGGDYVAGGAPKASKPPNAST